MKKQDLTTLTEMVSALRRIRAGLDTRRGKCAACDAFHYESKTDWHAAEKLDGAIHRIIKTIEAASSTPQEKP